MAPSPPPERLRMRLGCMLAILAVVGVMLALRGRSPAGDVAANMLAVALAPLFYLAVRAEGPTARAEALRAAPQRPASTSGSRVRSMVESIAAQVKRRARSRRRSRRAGASAAGRASSSRMASCSSAVENGST